jgi:hypothetical protein
MGGGTVRQGFLDESGFLDKATSMGYEFRASFKGVITFPSGSEKPGFDSKSGCCFAVSTR